MLKVLKRHYVWVIFIVAVAAQLGFPVSFIVEKNDVLANGLEFKVKTAPVDPADPFRGRYVAIGVSVDMPDDWKNKNPGSGDYYIRLDTGEDGFAKVLEVSKAPLEGDGILKLDNSSWRSGDNTIRLPYDRYYMKESAAPKAESAYRSGQKDAYVTIRVKDGAGAVSGLYIDGRRIEDYNVTD